MQSFKKSVDKLVFESPSQLVLAIVFVVYIILNVQTPLILAEHIDTMFGKVAVVLIAAVVFMKTNPVIGVLGFVVAYQMIKTSSVATGTYGIRHYLPTESSKLREMQSFNHTESTGGQDIVSPAKAAVILSGTLEEETVDRMAPLVISGSASTAEYMPILDGQHGASMIEQ